ncbi:hypothetical protein HW532_20930 [Kaustia mangrovi]|uniref:Poly A polymerase head domain-containing protein n=1 Tax=Kaustia mangrovi TaxID=2593653 RepID=A0A7S8C7N8_9HYPH|nr:hypothetical protein [Kaustia mangrovi]QPC44945.1 hypothetical protein HW532_20930 [Kaustia mangrovi]
MEDTLVHRIEQGQDLLKWLAGMEIVAYICGGYVRDSITGNQYRDVDIYVSEEHFANASISLRRRGICATEDMSNTDEYIHQSVSMQEEFNVKDSVAAQFPILNGHAVNLVGIHSGFTLTNIVDRFNLGICQAGLSHNALYTTEAFNRDRQDHMITLLRTDWGHEASLKQFIKLQQKYPWPMRIKPENADVSGI